ncbi:MAG: hypothetical protein ACJ79S_18010 [Gemmatimonadaceae bacterium]
MDRKNSQKGARSPEQAKNVREGFGDDAGTRVGRPDPERAGSLDDRSVARLSENADDRGIEGAVLAGSDNPRGSEGQRGTESGSRSATRADGSRMDAGRGETLDHTQRAESGMGGEANQGVHGAQRDQPDSRSSDSPSAPRGADIPRGTDEHAPERSGSEPLRGRQSEHQSGYGGEGGTPRTSSDRREGDVDYYGDESEKGRKR